MKPKILAALLASLSCGTSFAQTAAPTLPEVLVTATRTPHTANDTPGATYIVTRDQMDARNAIGIDSILSTVPGVFDRRGKGLMDTLTAVTLRGMPDQKRTLVMQDGMPMNDGYTGAVDFGGLSVDDYQRVEVALGAGSSLYGNNAMGGVVNLVTRMPEQREFRFRVGYGDGLGTDLAMKNLVRGYASMGDKLDNGLRLFASIGGTHTNGFVTDLNAQTSKPGAGISGWTPTATTAGAARYLIGARGDNHWQDDHAALRASFDLPERGQIRLAYQRNSYQYSYGQPSTTLRNAAGAEVWTYGTVREATYLGGGGESIRDLFQAGLDTALGNARLKINAGYNNTGTNWYVTPGSGATTLRSGGPGTLSSTPSSLLYADAQVTLFPTAHQVLVVGTSWRQEKANTTESALSDWRSEDTAGAITYMAGGKSRTWGVFIQDEIALTDQLTGTAGLRWDDWQASDGYANSVGAAGYPKTYAARSDTALSPKLGLVYRWSPQTTLRTSLGRAFRAPTVYELYRTWISSTGVTYRGNSDLSPETATTWDVGGDFKPWQGADLKATVYYNQLSDMIYRRTINPTLQEYINAGKARGKGLELDLRQQLPGNWTLLAGGTYNRTRILENSASPASVGQQFTQVPARTANLGAEWSQGAWSFSGMARYVSKRYSTDANTDQVSGVPGSYDAYTVVDFKAAYRLDKNLKLAFSVDNVLNKEYFASYRAPGRSYFLELSGQF